LQRGGCEGDVLFMPFDHEKLDVYTAAVDFIALAHRIIATLPTGHADLADQLRRAATSIALNIAEGAGEILQA
jgi:four helix bundle protein